MGTPLPPRDHRISKSDAAKKTKKYKETKEKKDRYPTLAFHGEAYKRILDQPGCVGIRSYSGEDEQGSGEDEKDSGDGEKDSGDGEKDSAQAESS